MMRNSCSVCGARAAIRDGKCVVCWPANPCDRLALAREYLGLSPADLARKLGRDVAWVKAAEAGADLGEADRTSLAGTLRVEPWVIWPGIYARPALFLDHEGGGGGAKPGG